jgi:formylglycine-generating enzyme required for sulfatase activity
MAEREDDNTMQHGATDPIVPIDFTPREDTSRRFSYQFRWLHLILASASVLIVVAVWFVLTARSVAIQVEPITAGIEIEGGLHFQLGQRYLIRTGSYELRLSNPGYHDSNTQLLVDSRQNQIHNFEMRKLPGLVSIESEGLTGARAQIDGVDVGVTPLRDIAVEPGQHNLTLTMDRYLNHSQTIDIEGREVQQSFSARLQPAWAVVDFRTSPVGAEVLVDGELLGSTPLAAEILQGSHEVTLKLAGHKAWQDELDVIAGEDFSLPAVELEPADGLVFLQSSPSGASVTVSGEFKGLTPLEVALAPGQSHELTFFKSGYQSIKRNIRTEADQETELRVALEPVTAAVQIAVEPTDAQLYINGELRGPANQTIELMAVSQQLEIRRDGYVPYVTEFTARPGLDQRIQVNLKSLEQARLEQIEPLITTAAGQQLKLFYPGAFTMGASRREPGRRANETLRDIQLEKPFYLAEREVTNAEFRLFDPEHNSGTVAGLTLNNEAQPVVRVSWTQAALYCNWLSEQESLPLFYQVSDGQITGINPEATGYRLPTEAEWAWVARTDGSGNVLRYSWGDQLPPPENAGNFGDVTARNYLGEVMFNYDDGVFATAPVASYTPNYHGIYDLAGNVAEWVHDFYGSVGSFGGVEVDPLGPANGEFHTIRGSSWAHGAITEMRLSFRDFGAEARDDLGFRVARYLE